VISRSRQVGGQVFVGLDGAVVQPVPSSGPGELRSRSSRDGDLSGVISQKSLGLIGTAPASRGSGRDGQCAPEQFR
jgi:hypothetical protein